MSSAIAVIAALLASEEPSVTTHTSTATATAGASRPVFTLTLTSEKGGGIDRLRGVYTDVRGHEFLRQTLDYDGDRPAAFAFSNAVTGQRGELVVTPTELVMQLTEKGETKTAREPRPALFAIGPSINRIVERRIADLVAGKAVTFRMIALNRLQGFDLRVQREPADAGDPLPQVRRGEWVRLRVEPVAALARLFAPKISTVVDVKTGRTLTVRGPLPSPQPGGGTIDDGTLEYERP